MTTDYNKTDKLSPTTRKLTGHNSRSPLSPRPPYPPTYTHTNIILMADKHNISKGKMYSNCRLLPNHIVCKITQRNNIRRANTCDPALKLLNEGITPHIQKHKQNIWKEHLDTHWDHRHNTHTLCEKSYTVPTLNTSITFSNKTATTPKHIANCFTKQFTNTVKHATNKTNRYINITTQVQEAIKQSINNNSHGPDKHQAPKTHRPSWTRIPHEHVENCS